MGKLHIWLAIALVCFGMVSGHAMAASSFFKAEPPEGWFWYNLPPEPQEPPEPEPVSEPPPAPPLASTPEPSKPVAPIGPAPYSAAWLKTNLPKYRQQAIDVPSRQNVLAYMYLQRLTMDKAQRFSRAMQAAVKTTPFLDESTRRPLNSLGAKLSDARTDKARARVLRSVNDQFALWFFYSGDNDCAYCASQASILADITELYGIHVTAISMDGTKPAVDFADVKLDEGQADQVGIFSPLGLALVNPAKRAIVPLSQGLLVRSQIMDRILLAAHSEGWISDEQYDQTLPVSQKHLLDGEALRDPEAAAARQMPPSGALPMDTDAIVRRMKRAADGQTRGGGF